MRPPGAGRGQERRRDLPGTVTDVLGTSEPVGGRPVPFGSLLTAMVTPFGPHGELDPDGAARLAEHLADQGHDGLVVSGTTGESPTTSDEEKDRLLRAVVEAVGHRLTVVAGVGSNDTAHGEHLARAARAAGADGLLVVAPYYSRPPQAGIALHVRRLAEAGDLPTMVYDIPSRTGVAVATETLVELSAHPLVVAVKDAKGDLAASGDVLAACDLAYYSGSDELNLPLLALGGAGVVSVIGHVCGPELRSMLTAHAEGRVAEAAALHLRQLRVQRLLFGAQAAATVKAVLGRWGLPAGPVRPPLVDLSAEEAARLVDALAAAGHSADDRRRHAVPA